MNSDLQALWDVLRVAMLCAMTVLFFGTAYDKLQPVKTEYVECSATIQNMARKLNVTLMDQCEVTR